MPYTEYIANIVPHFQRGFMVVVLSSMERLLVKNPLSPLLAHPHIF